jgi:cytochrome c553
MTTTFPVRAPIIRSSSLPARKIAAFARVLALSALTVACSAKVTAEDTATQAPADVASCQGCHGIPGYRTAFPKVYSVPKLGGQENAYLVKALQAYRSGVRKHATMRSIAAPLTDQQIAAIAAYYAGTHK